MITTEPLQLSTILTPEQLAEILADVRYDAILIDHHASKLFPKSPEDRLKFRREVRELMAEQNHASQ